jgi:transcriptional/translational regulatory protein YebC/TACO1
MRKTAHNLKELLGGLAELVSEEDNHFSIKTTPGKHYVVQTLLKTSGYTITKSSIQQRKIYAIC